ncbi:MAG: TonB-dependent receptor plug domain-containing protein [Candidatus Anammoxibacter sp.]
MQNFKYFWLVFCLFFCLQPIDCAEIEGQSLASNSANAQSFYEPHDVFYLMDEQLITVASKKEEKVKDAPSIITVITAEEIENMGFRTLTDALRIVPGFDIIKDSVFGRVLYVARGMIEEIEGIMASPGSHLKCKV